MPVDLRTLLLAKILAGGSGGGGGGDASNKVDKDQGLDNANEVLVTDDTGHVTTVPPDELDFEDVEEVSIDSVPTENSTNLVTSGGVYDAISSSAPETTNILAGDGNGGLTDSELNPDLVIYAGSAQTLTDAQKMQARMNIGLSSNDYSTRDKRTLANIAGLLNGNEYTVEQGTSPAYWQTVQTGAQRWAELSMVGGKSFAWNQFANATLTDWTKVNTSVTEENGKTKIAVTSASNLKYVEYPMIANHRYMISSEFVTTADLFWGIYTVGGIEYESRKAIGRSGTSFSGILKTSNANKAVRLTFTTGATTDDYILLQNFMLIDLTPIEASIGVTIPTNLEFKRIFPNDYYPYDAGSVKHCKCDKVVTADSEGTLIAEYPVPAAIQALDGYGESNGSDYNYVDFADKTFTAYGHYVDGVWVAYDAPQITDISVHLPNDIFLDTEVDGTVMFHQAEGTAVMLPNEVDYMVRTTGVINRQDLFSIYIEIYNANTFEDITSEEKLDCFFIPKTPVPVDDGDDLARLQALGEYIFEKFMPWGFAWGALKDTILVADIHSDFCQYVIDFDYGDRITGEIGGGGTIYLYTNRGYVVTISRENTVEIDGNSYYTWDYFKANIEDDSLQTKAIADEDGYFTTDTVEGALAEIGAELFGLRELIGGGF